MWHSGIGSRLGRNRLWVRFLNNAVLVHSTEWFWLFLIPAWAFFCEGPLTQLYLRKGRRRSQNMRHCYSSLHSTVDIHFQNEHKTLFQSTVDIHFQNAHKHTQKTAKASILCVYHVHLTITNLTKLTFIFSASAILREVYWSPPCEWKWNQGSNKSNISFWAEFDFIN